ncbi:MAG: MBL fold metallo-hydrolase, partial [Myxococcota bacterium]|nr:MBL fold metallo-hydrolase [Myxococcota bacterium]
MLEFLSLAGARQLAANAYLLRGPWGALLVDAGASLPRDAAWIEKLESAPDAVMLTHAHADHIGALPDLLERFPGQQLFASRGTRDLAEVALAGLLRSRGVDKQLATDRSTAIASCVRSAPMMRPISLSLADRQQASATLTLYPCGHILGAASMQLDMEFGSKFHTIYFLLDFCAH